MLSIIIPVFNQASYTKACLEALLVTCGELQTYQVVIVDNGSTDETATVIENIKNRMPIEYIKNGRNLGFSLGSNIGAQSAKGDTFVFLNNDTIPQPGWRKALEGCLNNRHIGIVGPRLLYPHSLKVNHAGYVTNQYVGFYAIYHNYPGDFHGVLKQRSYKALLGACIMIRRQTFEQLNGFSEIGLEDIDICLRTRELGLDVVYVPSAVVYHHGSVTIENSAANSMPVYTNLEFAARCKENLENDDCRYYIEDGIMEPTSKAIEEWNQLLKKQLGLTE